MNNTEILNEIKKLSRRIEEQKKTLDLLFKDREILEDVLSRLTAVEAAINTSRATATETAKDLRADTKEIKAAVESKVEEVKEVMDDKTIMVKSPQQTIIQKIIKKIGG